MSKYVHSYSSIHEFKQCPWKFKAKFIEKRFPYVQGAEAKYGDMVHKAFELYVARAQPLPAALSAHESLMQGLVGMPGTKFAERQVGIRRDGSACTFFDKDVWFRGKLDLVIEDGEDGWYYDYKTGKFNPRYIDADQLLYGAILVFAHHPSVQQIYTGLLYTSADAMFPEDGPMVYRRSDLARYMEVLQRDATEVEDAITNDNFPKIQSPLCGYCPVKDCEFWFDARAK